MANIRINDLPEDAAPNPADVVPIDGLTTRKTTLVNLVNAGRPFASQVEAEAGVAADKAMSPLTTKQSIEAEIGTTGTTGLALLGSETDDDAWTVLGDVTRPLVAPNIRPTIPITPLEYGAVFDGVTDDTSAILAAANAAIAAGLPLFLPPGTGMVGDLSTVGALRVIGSPGATIRALAGSLHLWNFDAGTGLVRLEGVTLDCDNQAGMTRFCTFENGKVDLLHCEGKNYNADGNAFWFETTLTRANVFGGEYHDIIGTNEIFRTRCDNSFFSGVHIHDISFHGIRFGPGKNGRAIGCLVENYSLGDSGTAAAVAPGSAFLLESACERVIISGNQVRNGRQLLKADVSSRHVITGNIGDEPAGLVAGGIGIQLNNTPDCIVSSNQLDGYDQGISIAGTSHFASVVNNWIWSVLSHGITSGADNTLIVGNQVQNSGGIGVRLTSATTNCVVRSNVVRGSGTTDFSDLGVGNTVSTNN